MNKINLTMRNEKGSLIVLSMVMLVLLTLIGIWATNVSKLDIEIAANEKIYNEAFHDSDFGVGWIKALLNFDDQLTDNGDVGNEIATNRNNFEITLLRNDITPCPDGSKCVEIRSDSLGNAGAVSIIAAIELQSSDDAASPGNDTTN